MSWVSEELSSVKKSVFHYRRSTAVSCKRSITQSAMSRISWESRCKFSKEAHTADQTPATAARKSTPYRPRAIYSATLYRRKLKEVRSKGPILGAIQLGYAVVAHYSIDLLRAVIFSSLRAASHKQRSMIPGIGEYLYFELASINRSRLLTIVAVVRYLSKLTKASPSDVLSICEGFWAL
jgi:hypothetical protein